MNTILHDTLVESGLTDEEASQVASVIDKSGVDCALLDAAVNQYIQLSSVIKGKTEELDNIKTAIMSMMDMLEITVYGCKFGKVNVIAQQERISYSRDDLDAIAKQNKALRKILDSVAKITIVKPYVRINPTK